MGMTITEKIIADHAGKKEVKPGDLATVKIDLAMANDVTAPLAIKILEKYHIDKVFDPERIALVLSHFVPAKDIKSAEQAKMVRDFAKRHNIRWFFQEGEGIEHTILPEEGIVVPGRPGGGCGLSYMHLRCPWSLLHWYGLHRHSLRYGDRRNLVEGSPIYEVHLLRKAFRMGDGQRPDLAYHRADWRGWSHLQGYGV
jgi:hypothetical protein